MNHLSNVREFVSAECFLSIRIIILPLQNSSPIMTISEQEIRCILVFSNTAVTYRPTGQLLNSESQSMHLLRKMSLKKGLLQHRLRHNNNKTIVIKAAVYYSLILATIWCSPLRIRTLSWFWGLRVLVNLLASSRLRLIHPLLLEVGRRANYPVLEKKFGYRNVNN